MKRTALLPTVLVTVLVAGCGSASADPLPTERPTPTPESGTAYPQFALHLMDALNEYLDLNSSIPSVSRPKAYAQWLNNLQDWAADDAYTATHTPLECYRPLWENHDRMARLLEEATTLLEDEIVQLDSEMMDEATKKMRQMASLSGDQGQLIQEAGAACG